MRIVLIALLLSGCAALEERVAARFGMAEKLAEIDHSKCMSYGIAAKTETYMRCRLALAKIRSQEQLAIRQNQDQFVQNMLNQPHESMFQDCSVQRLSNNQVHVSCY